ncbi:MAG: hemerythrin domain-containing protein [Burkholderiales bacterium]|nr:MAG: hemerythrin domain-containing protein [Burkholderiales bacterium]
MTASAFDPAAFGSDPPEFDDPFAILQACHGRIERMLRTLERLGPHVAARGMDGEAREAVARVRRYFELAGPDHHADEECDLFPAARRAAELAGDAAQHVAIDRLVQEHREMERGWAALRTHLDALSAGRAAAVDGALVGGFVALYRDHVAREEGLVYAAAGPRLDAACREALAAAMVARRR